MDEKVAFITGGATGIGKRMAFSLADNGMSIIITYRKSKKAALDLVDELQEKYQVKALAIQGDASSEKDCKNIIQLILDAFGHVDIFIHNAGPYMHDRKPMTEYSSDEWKYIMDGNLNGFFYIAKELIPLMRRRSWGRVISLGFERSETAPGWIYRSAFAAAKSGLTSLTRTLAAEEAAYGITVNMVCPGDIIGEWKEEEIKGAKMVKDVTVPIGRPGTGEDIARVITFLCDEKSDFITGSIIPVTGGKDVLGKIYKA
ncbi:3-oxoacyl-[acyl-carrier-protein] reductase FabG [Peribacillus sp. Bi96]|uniref:SDR family oxidoreductase n=1 Tax=unclassified Peribacillus TaxID=2675266 RepID=UPI001D87798A|nr:SDR family oxidoreductase [Peribacillus sp. Bi96]CAH0276657.1 3-oxoacyl-[acyl-carrier-protein] reductase FabG [Peribacillus sp. Bi96]